MTQTLDNQTMLKNIFLKKNPRIEERKGISIYLNILKGGANQGVYYMKGGVAADCGQLRKIVTGQAERP